MTARRRIVLLPGDGIGPEVVAAARMVLETAAAAKDDLALSFDAHSIGGARSTPPDAPLPAADAAGVPGRRRGAARRRRRAQVGRPDGEGAPGAGAARAAPRARALREPAAGAPASGAGRSLAAQARASRGRRPPLRARADRRHLLRAAAPARGDRRWRARHRHARVHRRRDPSRGACSPSAWRATRRRKRHLGRQGQRARVVAAVAADGNRGGDGISVRDARASAGRLGGDAAFDRARAGTTSW